MRNSSRFLGIVGVLFVVLPVMALSVSAAPTQHMTVDVMTHPSQGPGTVIEGAQARLTAGDAGITAEIHTGQLDVGHAHTLWVVIVNRPDLCESSPCSPNDLLVRTETVESNVVYGGGRVVRGGVSSFMTHLPIGEVVGGWYDTQFTNPRGAEVHLVVNDHGPIISGMTMEMTRTYRAGCTEESIPALFPASARADGTPGPNACRLVQVAIFQ